MSDTIVTVRQGSLTSGNESILVNASNTKGALGSGVSAAIRAACGPGFQSEIESQIAADHGGASMPQYSVILTGAGTHRRARFVAHVAVMNYDDGFTGTSFPHLEGIERACVALWNAVSHAPGGPHTVAMVALGAGTGQLGAVQTTHVACRTLQSHLRAHPQSIKEVTFYGYTILEFAAIANVVSSYWQLPAGAISGEQRPFVEALRIRA